MSQVTRVLAALRNAGSHGVTRVDFQAPNVIDGGDPILNFPGRIQDIEESHEIETCGKRNRCTVYRLKASGAAVTSPRAPTHTGSVSRADVGSGELQKSLMDAGTLFDLAVPPKSAALHDYEDEAA